jgi:signal transduction histidine kinase
VIAAIAVGSDATALKAEEARLRRSETLLVDAQGIAHLGTWEWDLTQPAPAVWSTECCRIYGREPGFKPSYDAYLATVHPDDRARVRTVIDNAVSERRPFSHDERVVRPDGTVRHLHTWGIPVLNDAGRLVRLIGVCQDVTDRKLAEIELEKSLATARAVAAENDRLYREAQHSIQVRDDFLSIASHELRTPLTPLRLQVQHLRNRISQDLRQDESARLETGENALAARARRNLQLIEAAERQLARLSQLVEDLIGTVALTAQYTKLNRRTMNLSEVVLELLERLRVDLRNAGCSVERNIEPNITGCWDRSRIEQLTVNLVRNAMKFGSGKPIRINLSRSAGSAVLRVQDFGIGIPKTEQARIFERFERAVSVTHYGGFGLGLYVAHQIAQEHGGNIRVESEIGEGATFTVELPLEPFECRP